MAAARIEKWLAEDLASQQAPSEYLLANEWMSRSPESVPGWCHGVFWALWGQPHLSEHQVFKSPFPPIPSSTGRRREPDSLRKEQGFIHNFNREARNMAGTSFASALAIFLTAQPEITVVE